VQGEPPPPQSIEAPGFRPNRYINRCSRVKRSHSLALPFALTFDRAGIRGTPNQNSYDYEVF
jgi:hypothetical protein